MRAWSKLSISSRLDLIANTNTCPCQCSTDQLSIVSSPLPSPPPGPDRRIQLIFITPAAQTGRSPALDSGSRMDRGDLSMFDTTDVYISAS